ncbi:hypothetical protein [Sagittula salina]|uniref:Uncharacterized protein n=1 Tax=Sagittula salina TaxID=2820268 RepID=A0A940S321_9RHOB|nr:hypothetical protein [Sagittula salina]MBP0484641.1 hypothetical protein [Sagittula salina]
MTEAKIHSGAPYFSTAGQQIMLRDGFGVSIGRLLLIGCDNPGVIAHEIASAICAPNRHGYRVGVKVGKASEAPRIAALEALLRAGADLLSVESEGLKSGIRIGEDGDLSTAPEDAHTVAAIEEIEAWIADAGRALSSPAQAPGRHPEGAE